MQRRDSPAILALLLFGLATLACAAFMFASGKVPVFLVATALILLALGQGAALLVQWFKNREVVDTQLEFGRQLRANANHLDIVSARMDQVEEKLSRPPPDPSAELLQEIRTLRDSVKSLIADLAPPDLAVEPSPAPEPIARKPAALNPDQLELLLEPIIELSSGTTSHYRARVNLTGENGSVPYDALLAKVGEAGLRPALDIHVLALVLPVLRRLRNRHPAMRALIQLGSPTLRNEAELARMLQVLEQENDAAAAIVLEIPQSDLASLEPSGIDGLAKLARVGVTLALAGVSVAGLDLTALRQLGVRFLAIEAATLNTSPATASAWDEFVRFAKAMHFQVVVSSVTTAAEAVAASRIGRFGYGPYFAPPRRVRANAGHKASHRQPEAA